jgi:hypothetical protein
MKFQGIKETRVEFFQIIPFFPLNMKAVPSTMENWASNQ